MELRKIEGLCRASWQSQSVDTWADTLNSVSGNRFNPSPERGTSRVTGLVKSMRAGGMDLVHVAYDLARVDRRRQDIRRDDNEALFLVIQLSGSTGVAHNGQQILLAQGDCILVDSVRPVTFLNGEFTNHLSVNLPRQLMISESPDRFSIAEKLDHSNPMASAIYSLVTKSLMLEVAGQQQADICSQLYDTVRFAFRTDDGDYLLPRLAGSYERCEFVEDLIDRRLTDPELNPGNLALALGRPLRRIQEDFQAKGQTLSSVIREKRLKLAAQKLHRSVAQNEKPGIAQTAFACGFNDISYFNRSFRQSYGLTPSEFVCDDPDQTACCMEQVN